MGCDRHGILQANGCIYAFQYGRYGEHGPTTVGLSGHKSIPPLRHAKAFRFAYDVVYTKPDVRGRLPGYGATQGIFAVESAITELADEMGMDPVRIRELIWSVRETVCPPITGRPRPAAPWTGAWRG